MQWAAHGSTAAEVIYNRIDAGKPHLGLTSFKGTKPLKNISNNNQSRDIQPIVIKNDHKAANFKNLFILARIINHQQRKDNELQGRQREFFSESISKAIHDWAFSPLPERGGTNNL